MAIILIDDEEAKQSKDITIFLKTLSPKIQERIKTIVWWESLKGRESAKEGI